MRRDGPWLRAAQGAGLLSPSGELQGTVFGEMSELARTTGAVNLGQGFPDYSGPRELLDEAIEAISRGENQYPPPRGTADLRLAIAEHQLRFRGVTLDPDREVLVTVGATEALAATVLGLVEPGEDIVVFEPHYDAYGALAHLADARLVTVPLRWPAFRPDHDELRRAVTDRTRLIIVNTPHNPTGAVLPARRWSLLSNSRPATTRSSSPTRSTNTSPSTASTSLSRACPVPPRARSASAPEARPSA